MKINFYLRNKASKTETPIEFVIQFGYSETSESGKKLYKKIKRSSGLSIKPRYWNEKSKSVRESFQEAANYNSRLNEIEQFASQIRKDFLQEGKHLSLEIFKERFDIFLKGEKPNPLAFDFVSFAEYIVSNKEKKQHKRILNQTLNVVKRFSANTKFRLDFETITFDFYNLFVSYLNKQGYAKNTKAKHISNVKYFMNEALKRKLHTNLDFSSFKAPKERVQNIYLSDAEIEKLYSLDLNSNLRLEKVRDLFLIGCYTGLRFSDFSQIHRSNIKGSILEIKTQKTGRLVKIPLRPAVKEILNRYNGNAPKAISNQRMNDYLKEIAKLAELDNPILKYKSKGLKTVTETYKKYQLVCTHTARRSFATNCYKADIPVKHIMMITGHTTETEFFKYIQIDETENAEMLLNHEYFGAK